MARIVIVDDDELLAEIVMDELAARGHMVSAVHRGDEALDAVVAAEPDLVILDYTLPGRTGMQILRDIRARSNNAVMPVLMLTGRIGRIHAGRAIVEGANEYVLKPIDPFALADRVDALLSTAVLRRRAHCCGSVPAEPRLDA